MQNFVLLNSFEAVVVLLQLSLMAPQTYGGENSTSSKTQGSKLGIQRKGTKVNFNKVARGLVSLFYHLLASVLTACWELSHLFHHTHPAT